MFDIIFAIIAGVVILAMAVVPIIGVLEIIYKHIWRKGYEKGWDEVREQKPQV